jgi:hypothetical protein
MGLIYYGYLIGQVSRLILAINSVFDKDENYGINRWFYVLNIIATKA